MEKTLSYFWTQFGSLETFFKGFIYTMFQAIILCNFHEN